MYGAGNVLFAKCCRVVGMLFCEGREDWKVPKKKVSCCDTPTLVLLIWGCHVGHKNGRRGPIK